MKITNKNKFDKNRRSLLKTIASAGISPGLLKASPLVAGMMIARNADALSDVESNKVVCIYVPGGALHQYWAPRDNFSLPKMSAGLEPVKNDCLWLRNMGHSGAGHGRMPTIFNNGWSGDSFEVNMGRILGANNPYKYINLGVQSNGQGEITRDAGQQVNFEDNPFVVFNRLFGNGTAPTTGGIGSKQSVIDAHKEALDALKSKLGTYEIERLDRHVTAIEETESRLQNAGGGGDGSGACNAGATPSPFTLNDTTFTQQAHLQSDIIALALKCNLTSAASIGWGNHQGEFSVPELNYKGIYHQSIHGGQGGPTYSHYQEMRGHLSALSGYLINQLKTEGVLDNTIVIELSDMGNGDGHSGNNCPSMIAGGGNSINTGNVRAGGPSYNNLHVLHTAAVALGADQSSQYQGYANDVIPGVIS
ncbi:DUF1552 domain-containing protein [Marinagarivorans algicola]|uniref:DUF1552 domain-containing protein n=1 Tax=Marinagarivorans algicola TaxID=1513270 RepID=UPI00155DDBD9|nr:DUF1552 domain-containing protein [Marinagarivorans algicola]